MSEVTPLLPTQQQHFTHNDNTTQTTPSQLYSTLNHNSTQHCHAEGRLHSPLHSKIRIEQYEPSNSEPIVTDMTPRHTMHTYTSLSDIYMQSDYKAKHAAVASCHTSTDSKQQKATQIQLAIWTSLVVNVALFLAKAYTAFYSRSLSVAASAVDSLLDLLSQIIVTLTERGTRQNNRQLYPAGKARLEPIGVILCAAIMFMASLQLISESSKVLIDGMKGHIKLTDFDSPTIALLFATIVCKVILWFYCNKLSDVSETVMTLAVDHRNDVLSNLVAAAAALTTEFFPTLWYVDPVGAIVMSFYVAQNWFSIGREQIDRLIGRSASDDFIQEIRLLASNHHHLLKPDIVRAYHFGAKYLVELEVVLPGSMSVREAHDISLALQQTVEQLTDVERAFVHVDYMTRDHDEHNKEEVAKQRRLSMQRPGRISTVQTSAEYDSMDSSATSWNNNNKTRNTDHT